MNTQLVLIAGLAFFTAGAQVIRAQEKAPVKLNPAALEFARQLIREGRVVTDKKGAWRADKPSTAQENEFVRHHGFEIYGQWHLGVDSHHTTHSKAHYKFPFGDFIPFIVAAYWRSKLAPASTAMLTSKRRLISCWR
jgi:hypothetical protein